MRRAVIRRQVRPLVLVTVAVAAAALLAPAALGSAAPAAPTSSTVWLCRPGLAANRCETSLTTTVEHANGSQSVQQFHDAPHAPIDCFYVYPTVSAQVTPNANLNIDPEEIAIAENQASRFSQACRVFAPMYRQVTIAGIGGTVSADAAATAYNDVLSAWKDYLAHDNHGRGVVFIGHSQGALVLTELLRSQIDPSPKLRRQVVSALLLGGNVTVASGRDAGGDFQHIPACRTARQTGCVVAYSSFDQPPPPNSLFGRPRALFPGTPSTGNLDVLCVNPASLTGGTGALQPYFYTKPFPGPLGAVTRLPVSVATPWVALPDLYTSRCASGDGAHWLQITDIAGPNDHRFRITDTLGPTWGLHLGDVNLAIGNLVDLVRSEASAYRP
jgi:hypothetical protein